jgi:hypothetical protein
MATIDELLAGFGEAVLGRPLAVAVGSGICELGFYGTRRLTLEPEPGSDKVHLYSALARLPAREAETVYGKLLTANLYGKGTGEAWFAIDPMREAIVLNRVLDTRHLDVDAFGELLTGFMDLVEHWSRTLEDAAFADPAEDDGDALASPPRAQPAHELFIIRG